MFKKLFSICLICCFCCTAAAQQKEGAIPLREALRAIEANNALKFSYIEQEIAGISISKIPKGNTIDVISQLEDETGLLFSKISDNYYVIKPNPAFLTPYCGQVLDADSNLPLPHVKITPGNTTQKAVFTDINGRFCLKINKHQQLTISLTGYKVNNVSTESLKNGNPILLRAEPVELQEVQVLHVLTRGIRLQRNGSYKIQSKNTGILPGLTEPDVLQTLQQLPGALSLDETISNISIRGGTHDQNLFLWNGMRLYQTGHFFGLISALNPNLSQSVTVFKNATPARYGQSVSGTVLIETLPEGDNINESSIGINLLNVDFNTSFKTSDKTFWQFSGRRSTTDFFQSPTYKSYYKRIFQNTTITNLFIDEAVDYKSSEDFYFYDATAQLRQKIGKSSELTVNTIVIANNLDVLQTIAENNNIENENSSLNQYTTAANAIFKTSWKRGDESFVSAHFNRYRIDSKNMFIESNRVLEQESAITDKGVQLRHVFKTNLWTYSFGYEFLNINIKNANEDNTVNLASENQSLVSHAAFAQANAQLGNFYLTAGLRQNYFSNINYYHTEPRLLLRYTASPSVSVDLQGEIKSQGLHQVTEQQEDFFGLERKRWSLANGKDLPVVNSGQVSMAFHFNKNRWLLTAEPFYKKVNNINSKAQGFQNQFEFSNTIGTYTVYGIEMLAQKQWDNITGWVNYQYTSNQYRFSGLHNARFSSNQEVPHAVRAGIVYDDTQWQFALGGIYMSGRYYTEPVSRIPVFDENQNPVIDYRNPNSSQLDSYVQLNTSASFTHILSDRLKIKTGISVQNILGSSETINKSYRINTQSATIQEINVTALERTFNAFIRLYFL